MKKKTTYKKNGNTTSNEALREFALEILIPTDLDTMLMTEDTLNLALRKAVLNIYLDRHCHVVISLLDNGLYEWITVPYNTALGQAVSKEIDKKSRLKMEFFVDQDYDKVCEWAKNEMAKGNIVVISKEKDGKYHAISYTKLEWALLNTKF